MMEAAIFVPLGAFAMITTIVVSILRYRERTRSADRQVFNPGNTDTSLRLERIEQALEAVAVEVERISEGQRFVTKLLAERTKDAPAVGVGARSAS
jgi:hypothetical protein